MRAGELDLIEGHGPGSGVPLDAHGIALLLIAVLATDSLAATENRVREIANARATDRSRPPFTKTFLGTLRDTLIGNEQPNWIDLAIAQPRDVRFVTVSRTAAFAQIGFEGAGSPVLEFVGRKAGEPPLRITATLDGETFQKIAADASAIYWAAKAKLGERRRK
jgi:hypothetical protein